MEIIFEIRFFAFGKSIINPWNAETPVSCVCVFTVVNSDDHNSGLWLCACGRSSSQWLHEPVHTFQNLQGMDIQLRAPGSVEGQQPTFSRKPASKQLALRVSLDKQMVTVCTQGECYQAVISQAAICPPNRSPWTRIPLRATFDLVSAESPGEHMQSYSVKVTLYLLMFSSLSLNLTTFFCLSCDSGADDLLPILSFVALRCQCPQLVSECAALEEFIHEGWVIIMEKAAHWPSPFLSTKKQSYVSWFFSSIRLSYVLAAAQQTCCSTLLCFKYMPSFSFDRHWVKLHGLCMMWKLPGCFKSSSPQNDLSVSL